MEKTKQIQKLLNHILSLEVSKGHLKWKVSDLSRISGIGRPLIYYHLGKTKKDILENCIDLFTKEFYGLQGAVEKLDDKNQESFLNTLLQTRQLLQEFPNITMFYIKSRSKKGPFQKKFIEIEKTFEKRLAEKFPQLEKNQIVVLHAFMHGIVSAPFVDDSIVKNSVQFLFKQMKLSQK